jgi:hypothetical protein
MKLYDVLNLLEDLINEDLSVGSIINRLEKYRNEDFANLTKALRDVFVKQGTIVLTAIKAASEDDFLKLKAILNSSNFSKVINFKGNEDIKKKVEELLAYLEKLSSAAPAPAKVPAKPTPAIKPALRKAGI